MVSMQRRVTILLTVLLLPPFWLLSTSIASAHDQLISTTPTDGQTMVSAPFAIKLTFNAQVISTGTQVQIRDANGVQVQTGQPQITGSKVTQPVRIGLGDGTYNAIWRTTSQDGHPISGSFKFTISGPTTSAMAGSSRTRPSASSSASSSDQAGAFTARSEASSVATPVPARQTPTNKTNNEPWLIIGATVIVMLIIAGITAVVHIRVKDDDTDL